MNLMNEIFTGHLSKFGAKVYDEDVYVEFVLTHISKNIPDQNFLDNFADVFGSSINKCLSDPLWDSIKFSVTVPKLKITFDEMNLNATLKSIKISHKETEKELIFKYDLTFIKRQEQDLDSSFATYLKRKDEDADGKKHLVEYDIEVSR